MKTITTLLSGFLIGASTSALAQGSQNAPAPAVQSSAVSGKAARSGGTSSEKGSPGSQTLMQQREKGMSQDGASGADTNGKATGKMKQ